MASNIISSIKAFDDAFEVPKDSRYEALDKYFARGGVINAIKTSKTWPKLVYPSPLRIETQIKELNELRSVYAGKLKDWNKQLRDAQNYHSRNQILKFSEPIYWKKDWERNKENYSIPLLLGGEKEQGF